MLNFCENSCKSVAISAISVGQISETVYTQINAKIAYKINIRFFSEVIFAIGDLKFFGIL
jgi:hypothetical protein